MSSVDPLHRLLDMDRWLAAPSRSHRDLPGIEKSIRHWTDLVGLDIDAEQLSRTGFALMAGRAFPEASVSDAALFGQWLAWLLYFDDLRDEGPLGQSAQATSQAFAELLPALTDGAPAGGTALRVALRDLWRATSQGMSSAWRRRFRRRIESYAVACVEEVRSRQNGNLPSLVDYPVVRGGCNGPFMWDLVEPVLGVELPDAIARTATWNTLVQRANEVIAWCNDIASLVRERGHGQVHNYVLVAANELDLSIADATEWVLDRILATIADMRRAAHELPALFVQHDCDTSQARDVSKVACVLIGAPRGHLDWLCESGRY